MVVFNLATSPGGNRVQHMVFAREPGGSLCSALEGSGVPVFVPNQYYGALATRHSLNFIEQVIEREAVDLINAHMADTAFLGWLAARRLKLPLVITHHGHDILPKCNFLCRAVYAVCLAAAARYAQCNIAVSTAVAERVSSCLALKPGRVKTITNGVFVPTAEREGCFDARREKPPCIVTVGRLVELKGQDQLIAAAAVLVKQYPGARFIILGEGPFGDRLRQQALSLGISGSIIFTGCVDNVPDYLRAADVYVSTSHHEGMPVATLEAMAWEVPVVASDVPGNRCVVEHGKNGLLYRLGEVDALARAIKQIIEVPDAARERARQAHRLVSEHYSANAAISSYERLYDEILKNF